MGVGVHQHICRSVSSGSLNGLHIAAGDHQLISRTGMPQTVEHNTRELRACILPFEELFADHRIGEACRAAVRAVGLNLHLASGFSNTVTVFDVPKETTADAILQTMRQKHGIMLAGSFDSLAGQVIRIGHMGSNANVVDMIETLDALDDTLRELNVPLKGQLRMIFQEEVSQKGLVL